MSAPQRQGPIGLLDQLEPGGRIAPGWYLRRIEKRVGPRWILHVGPRELPVIVEKKRLAGRYLAESEHFGFWIENLPTHKIPRMLLDALKEKIREPSDPDRLLELQPPEEIVSSPTLYLVPGNIGDPFDLSVRAVHVLSSVELVLVEPGSTHMVGQSLGMLGIRPPEIAEMDRETLAAALDRGIDVCIFGGDEGIPGFCDPGKDLLLDRDVHIRTVGGSSVLGLALMRVPLSLQDFMFLGVLDTAHEALRIRSRLPEPPSIPVAFFTQGLPLRRHLAELVGEYAGRIHLVGELTRKEEFSLTLSMKDPTLPDFVLDTHKIVAFLEFETFRPGLRGWLDRRRARSTETNGSVTLLEPAARTTTRP